MPAPASPASIAASMALTLRRDRNGAITSLPSDQYRHVSRHGGALERDHFVRGQILRGRGRRPCGEVGRARTGYPADDAEARRDQVAVGQVPNTQRHVDLIVQEMGDPVGQHQLDRHLREGGQEIHDGWQDV